MAFSNQRIMHEIEDFFPLFNCFRIQINVGKPEPRFFKIPYVEWSRNAMPCLGQDTDTNHIYRGQKRNNLMTNVVGQLINPVRGINLHVHCVDISLMSFVFTPNSLIHLVCLLFCFEHSILLQRTREQGCWISNSQDFSHTKLRFNGVKRDQIKPPFLLQ
jgi:hypothetical protein